MPSDQKYVDKVQAEFDLLSAKVDEYVARSRKAAADARIEADDHLKELRARRDRVAERLTAARKAAQEQGQEAWSAARGHLDEAWKQLRAAWTAASDSVQEQEH